MVKRSKKAPLYQHASGFRFLDLPAELRVEVYKYLLPYNLEIDLSYASPSPLHNIRAVRWRRFRGYGWVMGPIMGSYTKGLLRVNRVVGAETRAFLYGSNTYLVTIDPFARETCSLSTPTIFGPLGLPNRLHLLRDLRSISVIIQYARETPFWVNKRYRGRLKLFVDIVREHTGDANRGTVSLLTNLTLHFWPANSNFFYNFFQRYDYPYGIEPTEADAEMSQFCLEALLPLRGIKTVNVKGMVSPWFAQCLTLCLQSSDEALVPAKIEFPDIEVKKKVAKKWKTSIVSTWQWHMPTVDWKGFAQQNGVELPNDVDQLWSGREAEKREQLERRRRVGRYGRG